MGCKKMLVVLFGIFSVMARAEGIIETQTLFVPVGFDDNDEVVAVADGFLFNPCQKLTASVITRDVAARRVTVEVKARTESADCNWDFRVPFTTVLALGILPAGEYTVQTEDGKLKEKLVVEQAKTGDVDEKLYAPVDRAHVKLNKDGKFEAIIEGHFLDNCSTIGDLELVNSGKTLELLPLMIRSKPGHHEGQCEPREVPFEARKVLPDLTPGRYLLHVRSLNGQSLNDVFSNTWVGGK